LLPRALGKAGIARVVGAEVVVARGASHPIMWLGRFGQNTEILRYHPNRQRTSVGDPGCAQDDGVKRGRWRKWNNESRDDERWMRGVREVDLEVGWFSDKI